MNVSTLITKRARRGFVFSLVAAGGFLLLLTLGLPAGQAAAKIGSYPKDAVARYLIRTLDGREYHLAGLRGQVVVLDFLAVWCVHSRDHVPALNRFDAEDRERGLKILGLFINDRETSLARVEQFVKEQKVEFPVSLIQEQVFEKFVESKDLDVPQTLVYGRNGKLVAHFLGQSAELDAQLTALIKQELDKKN